jgi:hypothetical protein
VEPDGEHDRVEVLDELVGLDVLADGDARLERDALGLEQLDAPLHDRLVELHVGMPYTSRPPMRSSRS